MISFWQFIDKWIGKEADWDGYYAGQCVDLFRYYCDEVLEIQQPAGVWGAANFWTNFESDPVLVANFTKVENTADFTPLEGDVMIWNFDAGGGFGHVAMCTGENEGTQYFKSFDQNWSRVSYCEIVNHSYKNVYGVLRPKKYIEEADMLLEFLGIDNEDAAVVKLIEHLGEWEAKCDWGNETDNRGGYLGSERRKSKQLKKENDELQKQIVDYENEIIDLENIVQDLGWKLQDCEEGNENVPCMEEIEGFRKTSIEVIQYEEEKETKTIYKKRLI